MSMVTENQKIPVGISACLLGQKVRYDGGHKQSRFCLDHLSHVFEFEAFCPEVAIGMSIPREPIRLVAPIENPRAIGTVSPELDVTDELYAYGNEIAEYSKALCGYILMRNSPSCGLFSTKVYKGEQNLPGKHAGIFARSLREGNPLLPMEEEARLNDPVLRENFIARVFALHDWRKSVQSCPSAKALVGFHSRYKYLIMAHGQVPYKSLGRKVAKAGCGEQDVLLKEYIHEFMTAISKPADRKGHANALYHILGYLRDDVSGELRQEIAAHIESYRKGSVNLVVPMTMLNHYLKFHGSEYIKSQAYLSPYVQDLGLRNSI